MMASILSSLGQQLLLAALLAATAVYSIKAIRQWWQRRQEARLLAQHAYDWLDDEVLHTAQEEAKACGLGEEFAAYVEGICLHLGAARIKVGHLLWIFDQLEEDRRFHPDMNIPTFDQPPQPG